MQYGVIQIKDNDVKVLEICNSKEAVLVAEQVHKRSHDSREGFVTAVSAEFVDGKLKENKFSIL